MKTTNLKIEDLIPHRDRLRLIDEIVDLDDQTAVTRSLAASSWPTAGPDGVDPVILIELTAQSAAVCIGARRKRQGKKSASLGWIVGIKSADFLVEKVPLRSVVQTRVRLLYSIEGYSVFEGIAETGGETLARVQIQVFGEEGNGEGKKES
ncbi:MAG TPA: hypothetical protein PLO63_02745 [Syntrophales bacterium]|jgi:predicted hotdog family 3-hydroxylacyl-ACP dehydratase|nr:hypothetical protein [Syntrophales bacterium]